MNNLTELMTKVAWSYIGDFYKWGGVTPGGGFDCSGLASEILKSVGFIKRSERLTAVGIYDRFYQIGTVQNVEEGCFVFWGKKLQLLGNNLFAIDDGVTRLLSSSDLSRVSRDKKFLITHVEYAISNTHTIGASGGGSNTTTIAQAILDSAFVKVRPIERADRYIVAIMPTN